MGTCASAPAASRAAFDAACFAALRAVEDADSVPDLFTKLAEGCHALLEPSVVVVFLLDPRLSFVAVHSCGQDAAVFKGVHIPTGVGLGAKLVASNRTINIRDMRALLAGAATASTPHASTGVARLLKPAFEVTSVLAVPIMIHPKRDGSRPTLVGGVFAYNRTAPCARAAAAGQRAALPLREHRDSLSQAWPFADEDCTVLEALVGSFSAAFDRRQQFDAQGRAHSLSRALLTFQADEPGLRRLLRARELAHTACSIARSSFDCEHASLLFVDPRARELWRLRDGDGGAEEHVGTGSSSGGGVFHGVERMPLGHGLLAAAVDSHEPIMLANVAADPRFDAAADRLGGDDEVHDEQRSALLWPLMDPAATAPVAILVLAGKLSTPSTLALIAASTLSRSGASRSSSLGLARERGGAGVGSGGAAGGAGAISAQAGTTVSSSSLVATSSSRALRALEEEDPAAVEARRRLRSNQTSFNASDAAAVARFVGDLLAVLLPMHPAIEAAKVMLDSASSSASSSYDDGDGGGDERGNGGAADPLAWGTVAGSIMRTMQPTTATVQQQQRLAPLALAVPAHASYSSYPSSSPLPLSPNSLRIGWQQTAPPVPVDPDLMRWGWSAFEAAAAGCSPRGSSLGTAATSEERLAHTALALMSGNGGGAGVNLLVRCRVPEAKAAALIAAVRAGYLPNPFHCWAHAVNTMQAAALLAAAPEAAAALVSLDRLLLLVAAMGHDMGHRARNNGFEVGVASEVALQFGDDATLERFHAAQLARAVMDAAGGSDVLAALPGPASSLARRKLLRTVLSTDMARHMASVEAMGARKRRAVAAGSVETPFDAKSEADVEELMGTIVHVADFAGNARTLDDSKEWTARLMAEFRAQAAAEAERGLPVTAFMAQLDGEGKVAQLQKAFIGGVIAPLWRAAGMLLSGLEEPLRSVEASRAHFEAHCAASPEDGAIEKAASTRTSLGSARSAGSASPYLRPRQPPPRAVSVEDISMSAATAATVTDGSGS